jgi:hypothetical protein
MVSAREQSIALRTPDLVALVVRAVTAMGTLLPVVEGEVVEAAATGMAAEGDGKATEKIQH